MKEKEFDNNVKFVDPKEIEKRLKFVEILFIVGGILGGLGLKNENTVILVLFLITSLSYYSTVSNFYKKSKLTNIVIFGESSLTAGLFTLIAISFIKTDSTPDYTIYMLEGTLWTIIVRQMGFFDHLRKIR